MTPPKLTAERLEWIRKGFGGRAFPKSVVDDLLSHIDALTREVEEADSEVSRLREVQDMFDGGRAAEAINMAADRAEAAEAREATWQARAHSAESSLEDIRAVCEQESFEPEDIVAILDRRAPPRALSTPPAAAEPPMADIQRDQARHFLSNLTHALRLHGVPLDARKDYDAALEFLGWEDAEAEPGKGEDTYGALLGRHMERTTTLKAHLAEAQRERDEARKALGGISAIRDSIIGAQAFNWSEHMYPLVAVLDSAGFEGAPYPEARANVGTLIERATAAEARLAMVREWADGMRDTPTGKFIAAQVDSLLSPTPQPEPALDGGRGGAWPFCPHGHDKGSCSVCDADESPPDAELLQLKCAQLGEALGHQKTFYERLQRAEAERDLLQKRLQECVAAMVKASESMRVAKFLDGPGTVRDGLDRAIRAARGGEG